MVGMIGLVVLIVIIIIGLILGGGREGEKTSLYRLKLHLDNTTTVIDDYQSGIKSSDLRSSSASLKSIISNTNKELMDYLVSRYEFKDKDINQKLIEEATLEKDGLEAELFEAKINATLDRIYAHKMAYEISLITSEEAKIIDTTKNEDLRNLLTKSLNSLSNLYNKFNSFSETK